MLHKKWIFLAILMIAYPSVLAFARLDPDFGSIRQRPVLSGKSSSIESEGIRILDLKESDDYSNGVFEGLVLSGSIRELVDDFKNETLGNDRMLGRPAYSFAAYSAKSYLPFIPHDAVEEMRGIAEGAGMPFVDVLLVNVYDDVANGFGCSSVVIQASGPGSPFIHARNLDYPLPFLAKWKIVTKRPDMVTFGFPGYVGALTGLNSHGISLSSHTVNSSTPSKKGTPTGLLYRKILSEASDIHSAKSVLENEKRTMGNNLAIGSAHENSAVVAEFDAEHVTYRVPPEGKPYVGATNHFSGSGMAPFNAHGIFSSSQKRLNWFDEYFVEGAPITASGTVPAMSHYVPDSSGAWSTVANAGTVQSVIMLPLENRAFVAKGLGIPVTAGGYAEIRWEFPK